MKKIFITGGAGYVGAVLVPYLLKKGHVISVYDLMLYGEDVIPDQKNLKKVKGDIRDIKLLSESMKGYDIVIHLACISNDPSFELDPSLGKSINLDSFRPLVEESKKNNISRFIYASSSSVYGLKKDKDINENVSLSPMTDYSKYKAECEKILFEYSDDKFTTVVIRPATVCGYSPRQRLDLVVNILTNLAFHKNEISVFGGDQLRPNIHIEDMARAYEILINSPKEKVNKEVFNAGYENQTVNHLAEIVKKVMGNNIKIKKVYSDDNRSYHISSKKISDNLGFKTVKNIEDAVKDLKTAFEKKLLKSPLTNEMYYNIKRMNNLKLK